MLTRQPGAITLAAAMRRIDRYLLRQYVQVFLICFISLAGLYTVIDAFGRLGDFAGDDLTLLESALTAGRYYALQSLVFFNNTSGVLAMIAAMFTVTWIQRHNEMTALLAAGLPRTRVLRPVLTAAVVVALGAALLRETVLPEMRHELSLDSRDLHGERELEINPRYDNVTDILLSGESALLRTGEIKNASFVLPPRFSRSYGKQLSAEKAVYLPDLGERPSGYLLSGVTQPSGIDERASLRGDDGSWVVVTPRDAEWLEPNQVYVVSGVSFELLAAGPQWRDLASTSELVHELASPSTELGPDVRVAIHGRVMQPFMDITLLLLGLPLVVSRGARSPFIAMGLGLLVVTGFFLVSLGGQSLGGGGWLRPTLAAWLPLICFVPVAVGLSDSLRK